MKEKKKFFGAVSILTGTAIGAGIFGLPYAFSKVGFVISIGYMLVLGVVVLLTTLAYSEITLHTSGAHQFTGYAEVYLGKRGKKLAIIMMALGIYGALIAYLIEAPKLLQTLFSGSNDENVLWYRLIYFALISGALYFGLGLIVRIEKIILPSLILVVLLIFIFSVKYISPANLLTVDWNNFFLPYGVILFALSCSSAVVDMKEVLGDKAKYLKFAIGSGLAVTFIVYLIFTFSIVGVMGNNTPINALFGLKDSLGVGIFKIGLIMGALTMTTSFLTLGLVLKETYQYDFLINKKIAWLAVVIIPLLIVSMNLLNFVQVLGMVGSVIGGGEGILLLQMYRRMLKQKKKKLKHLLVLPQSLIYALQLIFGLGIIYEIWSLL